MLMGVDVRVTTQLPRRLLHKSLPQLPAFCAIGNGEDIGIIAISGSYKCNLTSREESVLYYKA